MKIRGSTFLGTATALVAISLPALLTMSAPGLAYHVPGDSGATDFSASANSTQVHVDALRTDAGRVVNLDVASARAAVGTGGLSPSEDWLGSKAVTTKDLGDTAVPRHSFASSQLLGLNVNLPAVGLPDVAPLNPLTLLDNFNKRQVDVDDDDEPTDPIDTKLLNVTPETADLAPLLHADVLRQSTVAETPIPFCEPPTLAEGRFRALRLEVLDNPAAGMIPFTNEIVGIDGGADAQGRSRAAIDNRARIDIDAASETLISEAFSTLLPVTLLRGTEYETLIEVAGIASLEARTKGTPGSASVSFDAPLARVYHDGDKVIRLRDDVALIPDEVDVDPVLRITIGKILEEDVAADGSHASGVGAVIYVEVLRTTDGLPFHRGATIALGYVEASVDADGAIVCTPPPSPSPSPSPPATETPTPSPSPSPSETPTPPVTPSETVPPFPTRTEPPDKPTPPVDPPDCTDPSCLPPTGVGRHLLLGLLLVALAGGAILLVSPREKHT